MTAFGELLHPPVKLTEGLLHVLQRARLLHLLYNICQSQAVG